jgi:quercetin dioxygenase-like cupin family protein
MPNITRYQNYISFKPEKFTKATLFQSERLLLGLNCFEPGQVQAVHDHADQDKFYLVLEGEGEFTVGEEVQTMGVGGVVLAPAGVPHGVNNTSSVRLVSFMGIAPGVSSHNH